LAAHPGYAATNLQFAAPPLVDRLVMMVGNRLIAQSDEMGALPTLYAAAEPGLAGGTYVGPDGLAEQRAERGGPRRAGGPPAVGGVGGDDRREVRAGRGRGGVSDASRPSRLFAPYLMNNDRFDAGRMVRADSFAAP
jgi:hypothetical protein